MGSRAPELGSKDFETVDKFVVGSWQIMEGGMDPDQAKQLNIPKEMTESQAGTEFFDFKAGGTFAVKSKSMNRQVTGKWQVSGDAVILTFQNYGDKTIDQARSDSIKQSESGRPGDIKNEQIMDTFLTNIVKLTEWHVAPDKKRMYCNLAASPTGESLGQFAMGEFLERLGPAPSQ